MYGSPALAMFLGTALRTSTCAMPVQPIRQIVRSIHASPGWLDKRSPVKPNTSVARQARAALRPVSPKPRTSASKASPAPSSTTKSTPKANNSTPSHLKPPSPPVPTAAAADSAPQAEKATRKPSTPVLHVPVPKSVWPKSTKVAATPSPEPTQSSPDFKPLSEAQWPFRTIDSSDPDVKVEERTIFTRPPPNLLPTGRYPWLLVALWAVLIAFIMTAPRPVMITDEEYLESSFWARRWNTLVKYFTLVRVAALASAVAPGVLIFKAYQKQVYRLTQVRYTKLDSPRFVAPKSAVPETTPATPTGSDAAPANPTIREATTSATQSAQGMDGSAPRTAVRLTLVKNTLPLYNRTPFSEMQKSEMMPRFINLHNDSLVLQIGKYRYMMFMGTSSRPLGPDEEVVVSLNRIETVFGRLAEPKEPQSSKFGDMMDRWLRGSEEAKKSE